MVLSIVMPAFNEADFLRDAVGEVIAGVRSRGYDAEVIVVENGSTDESAAIARELEAELEEVRALSLPTADYGAALRAGLLEAEGDVVVNFDVDYFDLDFLDAAVRRLQIEEGPVIVVATKRGVGADDQRAASRRLITYVFGAVLRYGFGLKVSDTHGMKAMRRVPLLGVVEECRLGTDLFDTELLLRAERSGLGVAEVPIVVRESRPSRTSIIGRGVRTVGGLLRLRAALWRERGGR